MALQAAPVDDPAPPEAMEETSPASEPIAAPDELEQSPTDEAVDLAVAVAIEAEVEPPVELVVPKGHKILISVEGQVGSKISAPKDYFPIKLAQSVVVDGVEVLPAGIEGEGQVVHARKGGFAGSAGELILAARYLQHGDRTIMLRSFKWIEEGDEFPFRGTDNSGAVIATNALIGPLGFLIGGGNTVIEPGTIATAKFRAEEVFIVGDNGVADEASGK